MCDFGSIAEQIVASLARWTLRNIENNWWFSFPVAEFVCVSRGIKMKIYHNMLLWDIFIMARSFLLIGIVRRRNEWHPTIFEVEGECWLQGPLSKNVWWIVIHVNIYQLILLVAIWRDQKIAVHRKNTACLMW